MEALRSNQALRERAEQYEIELKKIDYRGAFEADDETGTIFEQIKATVSQLDRFKGEEQ